MNDREHRPDPLDKVTDSIRQEAMDDAAVSEATDRVWQTIQRDLETPLRSCEDYQAVIPELVAGTLTEARALLVEDHTRGCVACRRALLETRGGFSATPSEAAVSEGRTAPQWLKIAAAAVLAVGIGGVGFWTVGNRIADHRLTASVGTIGGELQLVDSSSSVKLAEGDIVRSRQLLRTSKNAGAELVLADSSVIELAPRSEIELGRAMSGTTIRLQRGNIIVRAADQRGGRLYVATDDCRVAVRGTVFAVDHGFKGSRVSVIEGEVEVRQGGRSDLLAPGEQITTNNRLHKVPIEDQIAWSPHAEQHAALLRELTSLQREVVDAIEPRTTRTSTRLLDLAPADTVVYAALPNLTDGLADARQIVEDRLAASPTLASWWQENIIATGMDLEVDRVLDRLQILGETLGDEVVIAVPAAAIDGDGGPVVLAKLEDPTRFRAMLEEEIAATAEKTTQQPALTVVDDIGELAKSNAELVVLIQNDVMVAGSSPDQLQGAADRLVSGTAGEFAATPLHARLAEAYAGGVSWIAGVDMASLMGRAAADASDQDVILMDRLGLLDASTLIAGYSRDGDRRAVDAGLYFEGPRRGMAAWLAEPAAMGSLDFFSPQASFATAAVTQDPVQMFDELMNAVTSAEPGALAELEQFQSAVGIDLRADIAATLGGEAAFAVDGPVLPRPSWKLVVEVYDPDTLRHTIEQAVAQINTQIEAEGQTGLTMAETSAGGRTYTEIRHDASGVQIVYLMVDGYMVVAPDAALIDQALQFRASGVTLPRSAAFRDLLPDDGRTGCSALMWRNLGDLLEALPSEAMSQLPPEATVLLGENSEPGLWCAYGERDRIVASGTGESLLTSVPALGLTEILRGHGGRTDSPDGPLSSAG